MTPLERLALIAERRQLLLRERIEVSVELEAAIREALDAGIGVTAIARALRVSRVAVYQRLNRVTPTRKKDYA